MLVINVRNVHEALPEAVHQIKCIGVAEDTRNGEVLAAPYPVTTVYQMPRERVIFWPQRDANPFFHFYEALWMLGGRNDVASLTRFVKRMGQFSDDGEVFHGAYGHRWRRHFKVDQLQLVIGNLRKNANCRRQVIGIYDPEVDLPNQEGKRDIPCNLVVHFMRRGRDLDMTVFNRSNDIIWGAYGANAVHFSMLQEFIASFTGLQVGRYWQISDNWHAYTDTLDQVKDLDMFAHQPPSSGIRTPYEEDVQPYPMVNRTGLDEWLQDLGMFLAEEHSALGYRDKFFRHVALPMMSVHNLYKQKEYAMAKEATSDIRASDWRKAVTEWLARREAKREKD